MLYCNRINDQKNIVEFCLIKNKQVSHEECLLCPAKQMHDNMKQEIRNANNDASLARTRFENLVDEFNRLTKRNKELEDIEKKYNELLMSFWVDLIKTVSKVLLDNDK